MQEQTKPLAEQAWELYQSLSPTSTSFKEAFFKAVNTIYPAEKQKVELKDYVPTFEGASEEAKDTVLQMYKVMDKDIAREVIGSLAEVPYAIAKGALDIKDIPPNSFELQMMVFGVVARKKLEHTLSAVLSGKRG